MIVADEPAIEVLRLEDAGPFPRVGALHLPLETGEAPRQRLVPLLQGRPDRRIVVRRQPEAEGRTPVVVARQLVVEPEAFRAFTYESHRDPVLVRTEMLGQQRPAELLVVPLCQVETVHAGGCRRSSAVPPPSFCRVRSRFLSVLARSG